MFFVSKELSDNDFDILNKFIDRGILKVRDEEFLWPPFQVVTEICVSLALCFWAALRVPGQFLPILPDLEGDRLTHLSENLDFMTFTHRGRLFPLKMEKKVEL
ncbi:hypothetical protein GOP47_0000850 [Adiantum capillus-veneris]|uniref:Uncharacterized protein n=1 Tax=Adiantum capillus-veneris TaxID=13818 RepID=A0A9D4VFI3_ADICA|nr:hypothetical protein GOP47_0000850 [Adiantum capillus-veneris]